MSENPFDAPYGPGSTEYELYLRTEQLLDLQKRPENRTHPDELMFQCLHQVEELWMKLVVHELGEAVVHLDAASLERARAHVDRAARIERLLEHNLRLFETMQPSAYLDIRKGLGSGSGMDSPGFNRIAEIAPAVWSAFDRALGRAGVPLLALYEAPGDHPALLAVAEALVDFDAGMIRFKREHIMVVRRIVGMGTASLRGNPIDMLERSAQLTYFPMLWAVRDRLFMDFKAGPRVT